MPAMPIVGRVLGVLVACVALCACSGAEWKNQKVMSGYQPAKQLTLTVVSNVEGEDLKEAVEEFTTTLRDELKSKGIEAKPATGTPASPGAELNISEWSPGSRSLRYFVGFGSGEGHMTVVVNVLRADGASALQGEVRGYVKGGLWGGSSMEAPREAAKSIANAIATGKPD